MSITPLEISQRIQKNAFKPHTYLSNVAINALQNAGAYVADKIFPVVPVGLATSYYYVFDKESLLRDNVSEKPKFGTVAPAQWGHTSAQYSCTVDQIITGVDQIESLNFTRASAPGGFDPRKSKAIFVGEQLKLHQDIVWAKSYFNEKVWSKVVTGVTDTPDADQFYQFDNGNSDPITLFVKLATSMTRNGLRRPNKLCLGANVFAALTTHPAVLERVKFQGSTSNPASVTRTVLAELFGLSEVVVSEAVYNSAKEGSPPSYQNICTPNDALLVYVPSAPSLLEPSAGYTFAWDMLGNGAYLSVLQYEGRGGTHAEFVEGLMATDHKVTCPDLGIYLKDVVSADYAL